MTSVATAPATLTPVAVDPIADEGWSRLVERAGSVFHHPGWLRLLRAQYGYGMTAYCLRDAGGRLVAGLPIAEVRSRLTGRRLVALPFSDLCPPLVDPDAPPGSARALAGELDAMRQRRGLPLEVHGDGEGLAGAARTARFHHHVVGLEPDAGAVEGRFRRSSVLRGARRAAREGLSVERSTDPAALAAFYRLHVRTRARLGVPTQPRGFVLRFHELFADGLGFVLVVRTGDRPVAAAVVLVHRGVLTYKYGASDPRFLGLRPNNLLFREAIRWGCESGMSSLDLGRTDWEHESLRAFKLAFGAQERELRYRTLGAVTPRRGTGLERLAAGVLRRSPPVASRLAGELLYRHAG